MTGSCIFFPQSPLFHSHLSHCFLILLVTGSCFSLYSFSFFCSLYFSPSVSFLIVQLSRCTLSFVLTLSSVLFLSAYSNSISHVLSLPPSISCSQTVLHGQFTKSGIHSPFGPQAFNTIFNRKPQRLRAKEGEQKEREN